MVKQIIRSFFPSFVDCGRGLIEKPQVVKTLVKNFFFDIFNFDESSFSMDKIVFRQYLLLENIEYQGQCRTTLR